MFPAGTLYTPRFIKMNDHCSFCGQSFQPEPGYYFGAMYVSFGINVAFFIAIWLSLHLFIEEVTLTIVMVALLVVVIGLLPITFRLSRVLWIYIFVRYQGDESKNLTLH